MQKLNLPEYEFIYKTDDSSTFIYDELRRKYISLTPEEWVRQNFIQHLIHDKKFPKSLIAIEKAVKYNKLIKRFDLLVYDKSGKPLVIVECKAPSVEISQNTFDQIARYNMTLKVKYLIVTNGINHYCCKMDYKKNDYSFLKEIPNYKFL
ncbi:MAG: type I restriction enzyme HsdR N-terminal domain-containing protein [Bacteroidales bacterium]|nr:type I restriction enzyme HsdR N-terminal domain-containing protein [Bacteroidales bacterium]